MLSFDAGDLFLPAAASGLSHPVPGVEPPEPAEVERRGRLLVTALGRMGLTAFAPGERDLAIGPALLRRLLAQAKIPAVSANLFDGRGRRLFEADRLVETAGVKIGIFGIIAAAPDDAELWRAWGLTARDPGATARAEVAALRARGARVVVALVHAPTYPQARELIAAAPGIDWAVLGHSGMNLDTPDPIGGARALEAMSMGKDLGRLDLHLVAGEAGHFTDRGQRAQQITILADHQRQVVELGQRAAEAKEPPMRQYFAQRIAQLDQAIARESALLRAQPAEVKGSWFENRIIPLDTTVPDHPAIAPLVAQYNRENQRRAAAGKPVGLAFRSLPGPGRARAPAPPAPTAAPSPAAPIVENVRYAGSVACGGCHAEALRLWQTTAHARALDTLKRKRRAGDPTCVGCHVTGFMREGGTRDIALATGRLRDVGCEACHGPGLDHLTAADAPARRATIRRKVDPSVCLGCHTRDQTDGEFSYPTFVKAILGPGHGGV